LIVRALRRRYGRASGALSTTSLKGIDLGPGGKASEVFPAPGDEWRITPQHRKRLDLYGGGEGWSQAWYPEYADPMSAAAQAWLDRTFGSGRFAASVNEKGFVRIERAR
jgi:hypothetical protein